MTVFAPNGVVTHEFCCECDEPDIKVEHGKDVYGYPIHFEHCPKCGDSMPILCFDCPNCVTMENTEGQNPMEIET